MRYRGAVSDQPRGWRGRRSRPAASRIAICGLIASALAVTVLAGSVAAVGAAGQSTGDRAVALSNSPVAASNAWQSYVEGNDASSVKPLGATVTSGNVTNPQALVTGDGVTTLTNVAGQAPPILFLDYGKEVGGLPFFNVQSASPTSPATSVTMRAGYSELRRYLIGAAPSTTLAAPAAAGATNVSVASVTNFNVGGPLTIDTGGNQESATITAVGTAAGAAGTTRARHGCRCHQREGQQRRRLRGRPAAADRLGRECRAGDGQRASALRAPARRSRRTRPTWRSRRRRRPGRARPAASSVERGEPAPASLRAMTVGLDSGANAETATIASTATTGLPVPLYTATPNAPIANWIWNTLDRHHQCDRPGLRAQGLHRRRPESGDSWRRCASTPTTPAFIYVNGNSLGQTSTVSNGWHNSTLVDIKPYLRRGQQRDRDRRSSTRAAAAAPSRRSSCTGAAASPIATCRTRRGRRSPATPATGPDGWTTQSFDDSGWGNAFISGAYGASPWNTSDTTPTSTATNSITFTAPLANAHASGTIIDAVTPAASPTSRSRR